MHALVALAAPTRPLLTQLAPSSLQFISLEYLQSSAQCNAKLLLHCSVSALLHQTLLTNG